MGRILLNALTILSMLLCLASAGVWVRSYRWWDDVGWAGPPSPDAASFYFTLASAGGGADLTIGFNPRGIRAEWVDEGWHWYSSNRRPIAYANTAPANRWGFGYDSYGAAEFRRASIVFPLWLSTILFALPPLTRFVFFIRRRRVRDGHCRYCGYDLRATPDRCPECGRAPASSPIPSTP
jgi:hypothetical protein